MLGAHSPAQGSRDGHGSAGLTLWCGCSDRPAPCCLQHSAMVRPPAAPTALTRQRGQFWGTRGVCRVWPGRVLVPVLPRAPQGPGCSCEGLTAPEQSVSGAQRGGRRRAFVVPLAPRALGSTVMAAEPPSSSRPARRHARLHLNHQTQMWL